MAAGCIPATAAVASADIKPSAANVGTPITGQPLSPRRILDTRSNTGRAKIPADGAITEIVADHGRVPPLTGLAGLPGTGPSAVNINFTARRDVANTTIAQLGSRRSRHDLQRLDLARRPDR